MGDLADKQFAVLENNDQFWDAVIVNMGPSRRAGGGGIWCDGWIATFEKSAQMEPLPQVSLCVSRRIQYRRAPSITRREQFSRIASWNLDQFRCTAFCGAIVLNGELDCSRRRGRG